MTAPNHPTQGNPQEPFEGFQHLTANFIWCPNQFFDVCLASCSLVGLRTIGHVLYRTLSWLDDQGQPIEQEVVTPVRALIDAGVSKGSVKKGISEAINGKFVECTQEARGTFEGSAAQSAAFTLRWSDKPKYTSDKDVFDGFYAGEGCRTPVPKEFFTNVLVSQPHSVVKFVGTVLRHTVGYQNQFGGRRTEAPVSLSFFQKYAHVRDRATAIASARLAVERGFLECVSIGEQSTRTPAKYAMKWRPEANQAMHGSKSQPAGSRTQPVVVDEQTTSQMLPRIPTSVGTTIQPELGRDSNQSLPNNPTNKKKLSKELSKQQQDDVVAVDNEEGYRLLRAEGFDVPTARRLSCEHAIDVIERQIAWIDFRNPRDNRLGMIRKGIEQNWSQPVGVDAAQKSTQQVAQEQKRRARTAEEEFRQQEDERTKQARRQAKLSAWRALTLLEKGALFDKAAAEATSTFMKNRLARNRDYANPPTEVLTLLTDSITYQSTTTIPATSLNSV